MATRTSKTSTVKAKSETTRAPRTARARKSDVVTVGMAVSREDVARRAYERYCARGYADGYDVEDWLAAERELGTTA